MYFLPRATCIRQLLAFIFIVTSLGANAQLTLQPSALQNYTFSYSILEVDLANIEQLDSAAKELLSVATANGGLHYATWVYAERPIDAPFAGLAKNQLALMLAWHHDTLDPLNKILKSTDNATIVSSRLFEAIYLPAGLEVPTKAGFYIHREEKYKLEDVDNAVRLSREAWVSWEPKWGVKVLGLFREINSAAGFDNLNRIVWYPDYETWLDTRNFTADMESAIRFKERRTMLVPGSGIAIATDRIVP